MYYPCLTLLLQMPVRRWGMFHCLRLAAAVVVQPPSHVGLSAAPWTAALKAPLSSTVSQSLLKFMPDESAMLSNHLVLCCPLLLSPSISTSMSLSCDWLLVTQSCPTLCHPMECSPPGSSVHGVLQARKLEWVAIPFSRETSQPRARTRVSHTAGRFFTIWTTRKVPSYSYVHGGSKEIRHLFHKVKHTIELRPKPVNSRLQGNSSFH